MSPQAILTAINFRRYPFFSGIILFKVLSVLSVPLFFRTVIFLSCYAPSLYHCNDTIILYHHKDIDEVDQNG